jgi:hypothetical protein
MISDSTPLGGDFDTLFWLGKVNGSAFITLNNGPSDVVVEREVTLAGHHKLPATEQLEAVLWDGLELFTRLAKGSGAELTVWRFSLALEPNSTRVIAFVPPGVL